MIIVRPYSSAFNPSGMEKNGSTQSISSTSATKITGWNAQAAYSSTTTITNDELTMASGATAIVRARINTINTGTTNYNAVIELWHNSTLIGTVSTGAVNWFFGNQTYTFTAISTTFSTGDTFWMSARKNSFIDGTFLINSGANTYIKVEAT